MCNLTEPFDSPELPDEAVVAINAAVERASRLSAPVEKSVSAA